MNKISPSIYVDKIPTYYTGVRSDIVDDLPKSPMDILEIGCGTGGTLDLARSMGKVRKSVGVELNPDSAASASECADKVFVGDIESLQLPFDPESFDVIIISEVLEHLIDPWSVLKKLFPLVRPGGLLYASSPNVAHINTVRMLLKNKWSYEKSGLFDWTHLRWFTPKTYQEMVEAAGFEVLWNSSVAPMTHKQSLANTLTFGYFRHLFTSQIFIKARRKP